MSTLSRCTLALVMLGSMDLCIRAEADLADTRSRRSLNGPWLFRRDELPGTDWKKVSVPSSFQSHEGNSFHGVGWYKKVIGPVQAHRSRRLLVHFAGAATRAEVWWNDTLVGTHVGGWTPFRLDVTDLVRRAPAGMSHELRVRLDEKVGHNTQGFLPIIAPHFGGLWQDVQLETVPETYLDDLCLLALGDLERGCLQLEAPLCGPQAAQIERVEIRYRVRGMPQWTELAYHAASRSGAGNTGVSFQRAPTSTDSTGEAVTIHAGMLRARVPVDQIQAWSPEQPTLYEVEIGIAPAGGTAPDRVSCRAAFRRIETCGHQLLLNGRPLQVRGVLNWGYYPPLVAPAPGEAICRRDLEAVRSLGFNLMKFCLWLPPRRYLELADELGVLTWIEYPTWHAKLTAPFARELTAEFTEFFHHDRNHPSVILRSLTCESGQDVDQTLIRELYDLAHRMVPGCLVEDNSSWIRWHRIHDFYDDHPYGNNHTWTAVLRDLREYIDKQGIKPLLLGEAMAADTWIPPQAPWAAGSDRRPFWVPPFYADQERWLKVIKQVAGPAGLERLHEDSLRYAMLMRKYQCEAYRCEVPAGGYVVSVLRDFSQASMGLLDYGERLKWTPAQWKWQGDTVCLLQTPGDRRSFAAGEALAAKILVSHFGAKRLQNGDLTVDIVRDADAAVIHHECRRAVAGECGTLWEALALDVKLPHVERATRLVIRARLDSSAAQAANEWPIWVVPTPEPTSRPPVSLHASANDAEIRQLFPDAKVLGERGPQGVIVARRFDDHLLELLRAGGRVLLLPSGGSHSFPLADHWFLRGGPYVSAHPLTKSVPRDLLVDLQTFDLAGQVIPDLDYLEHVDPVLLLWDTHGLERVKTHGLVFETRVGAGRLLVSALDHRRAGNAAGRWLLDVFVRHLQSGPAPSRTLSAACLEHLRGKIHERVLDLTSQVWRFKPDPQVVGVQEGWHRPGAALDSSWKEIRVGRSWNRQGFANLVGWAWYRLPVTVPADWKEQELFLTFAGVLDCYEVYVNGVFVGRGGELRRPVEVTEEHRSFRITPHVRPGQPCDIAVRVANATVGGGIWKPVKLSTVPIQPGLELLR